MIQRSSTLTRRSCSKGTAFVYWGCEQQIWGKEVSFYRWGVNDVLFQSAGRHIGACLPHFTYVHIWQRLCAGAGPFMLRLMERSLCGKVRTAGSAALDSESQHQNRSMPTATVWGSFWNSAGFLVHVYMAKYTGLFSTLHTAVLILARTSLGKKFSNVNWFFHCLNKDFF